MKQCPYCYHTLNAEDLIDPGQSKPKGCVCDSREWFTTIPPICEQFEPMGDDEPDICGRCEHEKGCHECPS
jgi:hypothetical protein